MKVEAAGAARWLQSPMLHNILGFLPPLSEIFSLYIHTASQDGRFQPLDVRATAANKQVTECVVVVVCCGDRNCDVTVVVIVDCNGYRFGPVALLAITCNVESMPCGK